MENNVTIQGFEAPQISNKDLEDYTLIEINSKAYAIKTQSVLEIIKIIELDRPAKLPSCILGILQYEDKPTGVIDLREVFSQERIIYDLSSKILIVKTKKSIVSIICDKVLDIKKLNKNKIQYLPYQADGEFYDGIYINENEEIYIVNIDNIVNYIESNIDKYKDDSTNKNYIVQDTDSKKVLKERKELLLKTVDDIRINMQLYDSGVSFKIEDVKYYINMASVKEFYKVNNSKFLKIPNTPKYIFGIINIKGDYITILDIRSFLGNSKTVIKEKSVIIILNSNEFKIGILVDEILESLNIEFDEILQNKLQKQDDVKMAEFVKDGEIYQVIDIEKLLRDDRLAS